MDFRKLLDPFWGFILKAVLWIHDPRISWLLCGTKNHEMRGPPVLLFSLTRFPLMGFPLSLNSLSQFFSFGHLSGENLHKLSWLEKKNLVGKIFVTMSITWLFRIAKSLNQSFSFLFYSSWVTQSYGRTWSIWQKPSFKKIVIKDWSNWSGH